MTGLCFGTSTLMAIGVMAGFPTAFVCMAAMAATNGRGKIWPWYLLIAIVALGCAALGVAIDQPTCRLNSDIVRLNAEMNEPAAK